MILNHADGSMQEDEGHERMRNDECGGHSEEIQPVVKVARRETRETAR